MANAGDDYSCVNPLLCFVIAILYSAYITFILMLMCTCRVLGDFCNKSVDWCELKACGDRPCSLFQNGTNGYECGPCPSGYTQSGNKCLGNAISTQL
jgi:hypothetical protein